MNILYNEEIDGPLSKVDRADLFADLRQAMPDLLILHREEDLRPYECDGLAAYRTVPLLAVLPERVEQVESILRICHARRVPVVARGAGTGLSGGALPLAQGVLLVMARFNRILELNPKGRYARVQPGVRNLAISQAAAPYELYYAPDPSSQIACSIGGNVAENAGGVHRLKYGLTVHNVMKIEVLTMEGERITLGADALDAPGFDLLALFTGSEGMLGIVTEVTVKLLPAARSARADGELRFGGGGGQGGGRHHRRRHHPRRSGDDGQACDPGGGGLHPRRLPGRGRGHPVVRTRRCRARRGRRHRARARGAGRGGRHRGEPGARRSRARAVLGRAQECLPGGGAHVTRLLLHGRHHPPAPPARCCAARPSFPNSTGCAWPTCSTPATATCTR